MSKPVIPYLPKMAGLIVPILFILIAIVLNVAYRQALYYEGVDIIYNMQSHKSGFLNFIENIFSLFGNTISVTILLVIYVVLVKERVRSVVHFIFLTGALYYMTVLKQIF